MSGKNLKKLSAKLCFSSIAASLEGACDEALQGTSWSRQARDDDREGSHSNTIFKLNWTNGFKGETAERIEIRDKVET